MITASTRRWPSGADGDIELAQDAPDVLDDGVLGDHEPLGDALVGMAGGHQRQHVTLARGELVERPAPVATEQRG